MKKYYTSKLKANKVLKDVDPEGIKGIHVFKMPKSSCKVGMYKVCTELEYLNTY